MISIERGDEVVLEFVLPRDKADYELGGVVQDCPGDGTISVLVQSDVLTGKVLFFSAKDHRQRLYNGQIGGWRIKCRKPEPRKAKQWNL